MWSLGTPLVSNGKMIGRICIVGEADTAPLTDRLDAVVEMLDGVGSLLDTLGKEAALEPAAPHAAAHPTTPAIQRRRIARMHR